MCGQIERFYQVTDQEQGEQNAGMVIWCGSHGSFEGYMNVEPVNSSDFRRGDWVIAYGRLDAELPYDMDKK